MGRWVGVGCLRGGFEEIEQGGFAIPDYRYASDRMLCSRASDGSVGELSMS